MQSKVQMARSKKQQEAATSNKKQAATSDKPATSQEGRRLPVVCEGEEEISRIATKFSKSKFRI
jgi:hypothetical protein